MGTMSAAQSAASKASIASRNAVAQANNAAVAAWTMQAGGTSSTSPANNPTVTAPTAPTTPATKNTMDKTLAAITKAYATPEALKASAGYNTLTPELQQKALSAYTKTTPTTTNGATTPTTTTTPTATITEIKPKTTTFKADNGKSYDITEQNGVFSFQSQWGLGKRDFKSLSEAQNAIIEWNAKADQAVVDANTTRLVGISSKTWASLAKISASDAVFLKQNDPEKYKEYEIAKQTQDKLDLVNNEITPTTDIVATEEKTEMQKLLESFGLSTTKTDLQTEYDTKYDTDVKPLSDTMLADKATVDEYKRDYENILDNVRKEYAWTGVTDAFIRAMASKKQEETRADYQTAIDNYNNSLTAYQNAVSNVDKEMWYKVQQANLDAQTFSQKMQALWFYYQYTPQGMAEQATAKYSAENPSLDSTNPATARMALGQTLDAYYKDYNSILTTSKDQHITEILALAKRKWISVSQALKENFITPLQAKPQYQAMLNKAMGINNLPVQVGNQFFKQDNNGNRQPYTMPTTPTTQNVNPNASWTGNKITNMWSQYDTWVDYDVKVWDAITSPVSGKLTLAKDWPTGNIYAKITQANGDTVTINHLDAATLANFSQLNWTQITAWTQIWVWWNTGNVKDIQGNWLRKDGKVLNASALAQWLWSHIDVRVKSWGSQLYGQALVDYLGWWAVSTANPNDNLYLDYLKNTNLPTQANLNSMGMTVNQFTKAAEDSRQRLVVSQGREYFLNDKTQSAVDKIVFDLENEQIVKDFNNIQSQVNVITSVPSDTNNPQNDQMMIYAFAKVADPDSAVKEWEYDTVQKYATALFERYGLKAARLFDNKWFLTKEARDNIKATMTNKMDIQKQLVQWLMNQKAQQINKKTGHADWLSYLTDYTNLLGTQQEDRLSSIYQNFQTIWAWANSYTTGDLYDFPTN